MFGGGENLVVSVFCYTFAPDFENRQPKNHADSEGARKLLLKKRGAPRSCFCVPNPQKNVFTGVLTSLRKRKHCHSQSEAAKNERNYYGQKQDLQNRGNGRDGDTDVPGDCFRPDEL